MKEILLLTVVLAAAVSDMKTGKIPNYLILFGIFLGGGLIIYREGFISIYKAIFDMLIPIAILYTLYHFKFMGAGDIKLFSFIGFLEGRNIMFLSLAISFILGAIYAMYIFVKMGILLERGEYLKNYALTSIMHKKLVKYDIKNAPKVHFAPMICEATIISLFLVMKGLI